MNGKKYNYSLRFTLVPGVNEEKRIDELVKFCKEALIDDVIFFISPEDFYSGHLTKEQAKPFVDVILKAKARLDKIGVTTSLNPWVTLVHGDRGRKMSPEQNFGLLETYSGYKGSTVVCPISEEWRNYYVDYLRYLIKTIRPRDVWLEDDFRLHGHFPTKYDISCFCPEHMKLYAKELGVESISREEFVQGLLDNKTGYRDIYSKVSRESMEGVLKRIIDEVGDLGTCVALMTSSDVGYHFEGRIARNNFNILSKYQPTKNRLGMASYRQTSSHKYANLYNRHIAPSRAFLDDNLTVYSEIENAPMSRYCKSAAWTAYYMLMICPTLLDGATFDIFEFNGNGVTDGKLFAKKLKAIKPFLQKLLDLGLTYSDMSGVEVAVLRDRHKAFEKVEMLEELCSNDNFMGGILAMLGSSVKYNEDALKGDIVALLPTTAGTISEEDLKKVLQKKLVIMNADTVEVIIKRGLKHLLAIKTHEKMRERTGKYTYEQIAKKGIVDDEYYRASCQLFVGHYLKLEYEDGKADVYTEMFTYDNSKTGNGISLVNGNILVFPYYDAKECVYDQQMPYGLYHTLRGRALNYAINKADQSKATMYCPNVMVNPYYFKKQDKDYVILTNYLEDEVEDLTLVCNSDYKSAKVSSVDCPEFTEIKFTKTGNEYLFDYEMKSNTAIIIEFAK